MEALVEMLNNADGKKVYGYLKKPVKAQVNSIVDEMARLPQVAECYEAWNRLRDEVECYYKDKPREHLPLSQQKEFGLSRTWSSRRRSISAWARYPSRTNG